MDALTPQVVPSMLDCDQSQLDAEGSRNRAPTVNGINAQRYLQELALRESRPGLSRANA